MFTNAVGGQSSMLIKVLQGERELAGTTGRSASSSSPRARPKGQARVGVQFEIDANGILHVLARDTRTGAERSCHEQRDRRERRSVEKMLAESLEHAFEDVNDRIFRRGQDEAEELLPAVRKALEQVGDGLHTAERERIAAGVAEVRASHRGWRRAAAQTGNAALDEATQTLAHPASRTALKH